MTEDHHTPAGAARPREFLPEASVLRRSDYLCLRLFDMELLLPFLPPALPLRERALVVMPDRLPPPLLLLRLRFPPLLRPVTVVAPRSSSISMFRSSSRKPGSLSRGNISNLLFVSDPRLILRCRRARRALAEPRRHFACLVPPQPAV